MLGGVGTDNHAFASYAWGLEYRQHLLPMLDASLGYLNEGHLPDHHRDGVLLQLWGRTTLWHERITLAVGAGPYAYFDTQTDPGAVAGYRDDHGVGAVATAALSYSLTEHSFALMELNQVIAPGDVSARTLMLGLGYRLDRFLEAASRKGEHPSPGEPGDDGARNEVNAFVGETVINGLHSDASNTFGAEYRCSVTRHFELSASVLSDSDGLDGRHQAATAEAWAVQDFWARRLLVGLGVGGYFSLRSYRTLDGREAANVTGLASMTVSWRFTRSLDLRFTWHRGFTTDDQDRDIVSGGLGWRF